MKVLWKNGGSEQRKAVVFLCVLASLAASPVQAQEAPEPQPELITLTLREAIEIALDRNYQLRNRRLDIDEAEWLVREGYGGAMPHLTASSRYQRNVASPNPFAGSDAGGFFETLSYLDWLAYNEDARTDEDPGTDPLSLDDFRDRQEEGLDEAGIVRSASDNPFAVDNQFSNSLSLTQTLYDGGLFGGIRAAKMYRELTEAGVAREMQTVVRDTKIAFYAALFAAEQAEVVRKSVERTSRTVKDAEMRLVQGVSSKYDKLSAEVELANLESDLVRAENTRDNTLDRLKLLVGLPTTQPIVLKGSLQEDASANRFRHVSLDAVLGEAMNRRPDLEQAALSIELNDINRRIEQAGRLPVLSAFVDVGYLGSVPDNRTRVFNVEGDPFTYDSETSNFFDSSYWNSTVAVGLSLKWTIFDGFQTRSRIQRAIIDRQRSEIGFEQLQNQVRLEIESARRELFTADERMSSQLQNVSRAELNYEYASTRVREGVSSRLEEREASDLLDESRLNYNRAVYDYLAAQANFEAAVGTGVSASGDMADTGLTAPEWRQSGRND